jgi:superoxide dismutase, Cu-Zn family
MIRTTLCATVLMPLLALGCAKNEQPRTPQAMNADGSGPSYNGPGTPWQDPDMSKGQNPEPPGTMAQSERRASTTLITAPGYQLAATAQFTEVREGVKIRVEVSGAPPGRKGIHIHQTADCSDIPNKSMGSHFAPEGHDHGLPGASQRHLGDLGNIEIGADGSGVLDIIVADANLKMEDARSFVTRSLVLHEAEDKGTGDSGESGKPIACGPIG